MERQQRKYCKVDVLPSVHTSPNDRARQTLLHCTPLPVSCLFLKLAVGFYFLLTIKIFKFVLDFNSTLSVYNTPESNPLDFLIYCDVWFQSTKYGHQISRTATFLPSHLSIIQLALDIKSELESTFDIQTQSKLLCGRNSETN